MKVRPSFIVCAVICAMATGTATAQSVLRQPVGTSPYAYGRYYAQADQEAAASPSDQAAPVKSVTNGNGAAVGCDAGCAAPVYGGCGAGCASAVPSGCSSCGGYAGGCNSCRGGCTGRLKGMFDRVTSKCCPHDDPWQLFGEHECSGLTMGGWLAAGYYDRSNDLFNSFDDHLNITQAWLYAEKLADNGGCGVDWGYRFDIMYGTDADDTQAFGNPPGTWDYQNGFDYGPYGWAIPQLYAELAVNDVSLKIGHFYTLVGYEVVPAPDNFFFSHSMTMYNSQPFTHTGVVASYANNDRLTTYAGWTLGWDTGYDQFASGSSWLGGFSYHLSDDATLTYISTAGNFGARGRDAYEHSIVLDVAVNDRLNYVLETDYLRVDSTGEDNFSLINYLLYSVNDCWAFGTRLEWWKADAVTGYAPHGGVIPTDGGSYSYYEATFGLNYKPTANLTFRPEARVDWSPAVGYSETYYGSDMILTF